MRRLLIVVGLALAVQALPLSEPTTEVPIISSQAPVVRPSMFGGLIKKQMLRPLPEPGPGSRPTREASATTTAHPLRNADLINKHVMVRSLSEPGPGPNREALAASTEATTSHPFLSSDLINQHALMSWSLPQPGPGPRPTREVPVISSEPTEHPYLSADLIEKHTLMSWSLPQPGPGARPTAVQPDTDSSLSPAHLEHPRDLALSTPPPRSVRAAPRPLPAHKAHGPRAILPYGPYTTRNYLKV